MNKDYDNVTRGAGQEQWLPELPKGTRLGDIKKPQEIPKPKYRIGDIIVFKDNTEDGEWLRQVVIDKSDYQVCEYSEGWNYLVSIGGSTIELGDEDILYKL